MAFNAESGAPAPQVSIVVPVYNVEAYLRRCLDSILAQTLKEWECICVDDGSTDGSADVLDEYAARDGRFVVIRQENGGVACARNAGIDAARGEYIGFIDPDDWIESETYELALEAARRRDADIVQWGFLWERKDGAAPSPKRPEAFSGFDGCKDGVEIHVWCKLFRAAFLAENSLRFIPSLRVGEDIYFSDLAYGLCKRGASINRPLYHHDSTRQTSLVHTGVGAKALESDEAIQALIGEMMRIESLLKEQDVAVIAGGGQTSFFLPARF